MKIKRVFKRSLAMELVGRGHKIIRIEENKHKSNFLVYLFEDSFTLAEDIYLSNKKQSL
ncbi:hypothetical protein [Peribacillus frigoritolerans]|uniref:hypothetical protein n=1 Tax=Peribacillus frigoritolerans TaxID=450367 RepID=UPI0014051CDB|nr:hypothetical protein [Peribacillus frigoritolerans]